MRSSDTVSRVAFQVRELDCAEEVRVLRGALESEPGIVQLDFDVLHGRMHVSYEPRVTSPQRIMARVARAGMHARRWERDAVADEAERAERRRGTLRWILTVLAGLATLAGFLAHLVATQDLAASLGHAAAGGSEAAGTPWFARLAYSVAIAAGLWFVLPRAWSSLLRLRADMHLLMTLAVVGAVVLDEWLEAALVSLLFAVALLLEQYSVGHARRAIAALMDLAPPTARRREPDGVWRLVPIQQVEPGDVVRVQPGERIPLDGVVHAGSSAVNQAPITGESNPRVKHPGDEAYAGTINQEGTLELRVTHSASDSTLARIVHLIEQARERRAVSEQWVEQFARWYTPAVILLAILVGVLPPLLFGADWPSWLYNGLVLLVIACPCALVISTPVSIVAALAAAARQGVLVKGGRALEACAAVDCVVFDKTGTLTRGQPAVQRVRALADVSEEQLIRLAAALESHSSHPLAKAIREYAETRGLDHGDVEQFQLLPGKGAEGRIAGRLCWIGNRRLMRERQAGPSGGGDAEPSQAGAESVAEPSEDLAERIGLEWEDAGHSVVVLGAEQNVLGLIGVADELRDEAIEALAALRELGIERMDLLTGDNQQTAREVARRTGIRAFLAEALPEDKMRHVERLADQFDRVAMVGDGINDGPAMAAAHVSVAMGRIGSDVAIEAGDVTLMADDLSRLPWLVRHARRTRRIIVQNCALAVGLKLLFVSLAVLGAATLWAAIAADTGASLLVIFNSLRLLAPRGLAARV